MFKNCSSTLINTGLQLICRELINRIIIGFPDVWIDVDRRCDFSGCGLFRVLCLPNSLCIIRCLHSDSAIISLIVVAPINFQIYGRRTALTSIQMTTNSRGIIQQRVHRTKVQDVNNLLQRLIDVSWDGVEECYSRWYIDQRCRRLRACIRDTGGLLISVNKDNITDSAAMENSDLLRIRLQPSKFPQDMHVL